MEKSVSSLKILNVILCVIMLIIFVIGTRSVKANEINGNNDEVLPSIHYKLGNHYPSLLKNEKLVFYKENNITKDLDYYINENIETINFFSKAFGYNVKDVISDLKERESNNKGFSPNNIGYIKDKDNRLKEYDNFEYGLIEYFYELTKDKNLPRNAKHIPYTGTAEYVENLIIYYSSIYQNVDKATLLSIGAAESGYYKVKYMLKQNNVYGGMTSKGLIKHNNIELGTLSFVRMMSKNYYGKGLDTLNEIGRVYCPVFIEGKKQASSHWINLVTTAKKKYSKYDYIITIKDLTNKLELI